MRVLVVNQYYPPDRASTGHYAAGICGGLAGADHEVRVITSQPSYTRDAPAAPESELVDGVDVHRVGLLGIRGREEPWRRYPGYGIFMLRAGRQARLVARSWRPDVVLTFHNPPFAGLIGAHLARRYDVPFVYSPYDILPDVVHQAGWSLPSLAFAAWDALNAFTYRHASRVVVLSEGMRSHLVREKGVDREKIEIVRLWARPEIDPSRGNDVRERLGISRDSLLLLYAGNMGYMHRLAELVDAARYVEDLPVSFVFVGGGPRRRALAERIENADGLEHVRLLPYQPESEFRALVAAADAGFVSLAEGMDNLAFPSRTLTFMSADTPILALTAKASSYGRWVDEVGCGWEASDAGELAEIIRRLESDRGEIGEKRRMARGAYEERFGRGRTVSEYERILREAVVDSQRG